MSASELLQDIYKASTICRYTNLSESDEFVGGGLRDLIWRQSDGSVEVYVTAEGWIRDITKEAIKTELMRRFDQAEVTGHGSAEDPITFEYPSE